MTGFYTILYISVQKELYNIDRPTTIDVHADKIFLTKPFYHTLRVESDILCML